MEGIGGGNTVSNVFSIISLICWIFVYTPQLWKNYRLKSNAAEALSMGFLVCWLIGDMFYIIAAICKVFFLKNLGYSVLAIGIWYAVADLILIFQTVYYRKNYTVTVIQEAKLAAEEPCLQTETQFEAGRTSSPPSPALADGTLTRLVYPPAAEQAVVHTSEVERHGVPLVVGAAQAQEEEERLALHSHWVFPLLFLYVAFATSSLQASPAKRITAPAHPEDWRHGVEVLAQVCAWCAFACFVGARLPQLYKNWVNKTAGGLSTLMFVLCLIGNVTLLTHFATSDDGVMPHLSFFATGTGCLVLDGAIGLQTLYYRKQEAKAIREAERIRILQLKTAHL